MPAAHVHSLLHVNLNTGDVATSGAFYERVLGLGVRMRTSGEPTPGNALGVAGITATLAWFLYDSRGPRTAPAMEVLEWRSPKPISPVPAEPNHSGLRALGFVVPSLADLVRRASAESGAPIAELGSWPWRNGAERLIQLRDPDGVAVEILEDASLERSQFSHVRLNVRSLEASVEWYSRIGLTASREPVAARVETGAEGGVSRVTIASLGTPADPSLSFELTSWQSPSVTGHAITPANHLGLYRLALGVDDATAACQELRQIWADIAEPIWVPLPGTKLGGVTVLFLRDPDGVTVELVERPRAAMTGRSG
jgi:catechol 2,3-dioxygenase-like lactoylglutathione lyase family enzyme